MKIAIISKASLLGGGASLVATDLVKLLREDGHFVKHYRRDLEKGFNDQSPCVYGKFEKIAKKTYYKLKYWGFQEIIPWEYFHLKNEIKKYNYDLLHFHDLTTAISPITLILLSKKIPIVWTLHDTSSFTGGCINPFGCEEFKNTCNPCPQRNNWPFGGKFDLAFLHRYLKKLIHKEKNIHLISPSKWLSEVAYSSKILNQSINIIPNTISSKLFLSKNKIQSKKNLFINEDEFTILLAAGTVTSESKGFNYALEILKSLNPEKFTLILVGKLFPNDIRIFKDFKYVASGFTTNKDELSQYFSAADVFLNCSLGDNFPLVVLESLAAGTPVVGFNTGGIKEMIEQNHTGFLSDTKNIMPLIEKLDEIIISKEYKIWSQNAREYFIKNFDETMFLNNHLKLYDSILKKGLIQ